MGDIVFVHIVEKGELESKSILLCSSIRTFCGIYKDSKIYAITPRKGKEISNETKELYNKLNVSYIYKELNVKWQDQPYLNSTYGAAFIEREYFNKPITLVYVDSDTFFMNQPDALDLARNNVDIAVSPIDSIDAEVPNFDVDHISDYWKNVYRLVGIKFNDLWYVRTLHDNRDVIAYFNLGIVAVNPSLLILNNALEKIEQAHDDEYFSSLRSGSMERFFLDQVFVSAVIIKHPRDRILLLNSNYNLSLPVVRSIKKEMFTTLVHIHYHHMFFYKKTLKIFESEEKIYDFLKSYVPFKVSTIYLITTSIKSHIPIKLRNFIRGTFMIKFISKILNKIGINIG